jgi:hypothetical protein
VLIRSEADKEKEKVDSAPDLICSCSHVDFLGSLVEGTHVQPIAAPPI